MSTKEFFMYAAALAVGYVVGTIILTKIVPSAWGGSANWEE